MNKVTLKRTAQLISLIFLFSIACDDPEDDSTSTEHNDSPTEANDLSNESNSTTTNNPGNGPPESGCTMTLTGALNMSVSCTLATSTDPSNGEVAYGLIGVDESAMQIQVNFIFTDSAASPVPGSYHTEDMDDFDITAINFATFAMYEAKEETSALTITTVVGTIPSGTVDATLVSMWNVDGETATLHVVF